MVCEIKASAPPGPSRSATRGSCPVGPASGPAGDRRPRRERRRAERVPTVRAPGVSPHRSRGPSAGLADDASRRQSFGAWRYGGEDERVAKGAVRAEGVVAQLSLQVEAGAFGDARLGGSTGRNGSPRVSPPGRRRRRPLCCGPSRSCSPVPRNGCGTSSRSRTSTPPSRCGAARCSRRAFRSPSGKTLQVKVHPELGPLQEAHPRHARADLRVLGRPVHFRPGHSRERLVRRLPQGGVQLRTVAWHRGPDQKPPRLESLRKIHQYRWPQNSPLPFASTEHTPKRTRLSDRTYSPDRGSRSPPLACEERRFILRA
jgi:hypothetical protein